MDKDQMSLGGQISTETARKRAALAAQALAADPRVLLVFLFGSAADEGRVMAQDVDLALLTDPPLELNDLLQIGADLVETAGPRIELISLNSAPVVLAYEVATSGRCLFARLPELETDFVVRAILRYLDFKPYLEAQWQVAGERLAERQRGLAG